MGEKRFRFEGLEIWQKAADFSDGLFDLAEVLDERRFYRFAEQLRSATMSITNNIAEGSGSVSDAEFVSFLNYVRRSVFETANQLMLLSRKGYLHSEAVGPFLTELEEESRMILAFIRSLRS
jgi:four helix bundle protein